MLISISQLSFSTLFCSLFVLFSFHFIYFLNFSSFRFFSTRGTPRESQKSTLGNSSISSTSILSPQQSPMGTPRMASAVTSAKTPKITPRVVGVIRDDCTGSINSNTDMENRIIDNTMHSMDKFKNTSMPPSSSSLARTEQYLWSILNSQFPLENTYCPSKEDTSHLLRYYRRLLTLSKWKAINTNRNGLLMSFAFGEKRVKKDNNFDEEIDSFFSVIYVMSVICRAIVLGQSSYGKIFNNESENELKNKYKNSEKNRIENIDNSIKINGEIQIENSIKSTGSSTGNILNNVTFAVLMNSLSPSIKSDIANALLAGLGYCSAATKKRFDVLIIDQLLIPYTFSNLQPIQMNSAVISSKNSHKELNYSNKEDDKVKIDPSTPSLPLPQSFFPLSPLFPSHDPIDIATNNFLHQSNPNLPALAVFKTISDRLPLSQSIEETLMSIFS